MSTPSPLFQKISLSFVRFAQDYTLSRRLAAGLSVAAFLSVVATFVALAGGKPFSDKSARVLPFIYLDLTLMLLLAVIIAKRLVELWVERRRGLAGSKLHVQIVGLFSFIAIIPAILVAGFAAIFINVGVQSWFSEPVRAALSEAQEVADSYLKEHKQTIKHDALDIVRELAPEVVALSNDPKTFSRILTDKGYTHRLSEVVVINGNKQVVARSLFAFSFEFENLVNKDLDRAINFVQAGERVAFLADLGKESIDRVRVLVRLDPITDTYLYVGKLTDKAVLKHIARTEGAIKEYDRLGEQSTSLQLTFILFFAAVALLLLLAAIWGGLTIATLLMRPITRLIVAAEQVSQGDLTVQVTAEGSMNNELGNLAQAFNRMTSQLNSQRKDLIKANIQIDRRREFIETVLAQISAGVIRLDEKRRLDLVNHRAAALLSVSLEKVKRKKLEAVANELSPLLDRAVTQVPQQLNEQVTLVRRGLACILQVSVIVQIERDVVKGYVITFDDVTALVSAQRKAAWSDVARRIAHEIKNPLTPIQLSAERLKRRYLKEISSDPETFNACIETIVRQVGQIGNLISEFSSFARMPNPIMKEEDLAEICRQAVFLQTQARPSISFQLQVPQDSVMVRCDAQQISQLLTNLLQNSINALEAFYSLETAVADQLSTAKIALSLEVEIENILLIVEDNGPGFPVEGREQLTEPYFTTHTKGTGLGLAIVAKIVEDHRGKLELGDSSLGGAKVTIELPIAPEND
ncbi:MAG: PAS domain-containing sensor histidine kinase [Alphaproteobacteria bacterium]|jgi:two-component system nitrogen regulation sensor histidine kinase NtrY|nr:PAS domain-containing sensor histidine kinase [Alphaproteobacteria bacterium]